MRKVKTMCLSALCASALLFAAPAQAQSPKKDVSNPAELTVSAAASLRNAFTTLKEAFEKAHPGIKVHTNFAASNPLLQQMQQGAPVDVFASADQETMDKAQKSDLIFPDSRKDFAGNSLVLIIPHKGKAFDLKSLHQAQRIAIGNPDSVPAGRYTRGALQKIQQWDSLKSKFILGESVRQVLDYVSRGEVDAGFVYGSDAAQAKNSTKVVTTLPTEKAIVYPIAMTKANKNTPIAQAFIAYVLSKEGQKVLQDYGFSPVK